MKNTFLFPLLRPIALAVILTTGCASVGDQNKEPAKQTEVVSGNTKATTKNNSENPTIELFDSGLFDAKLSNTLSKGPDEVFVKPLGDTNVNAIPERLDKWLSYIENKGGSVELKPDPKEKSRFIGEIIELGIKIYQAIYDSALYSPAENYNATVYYKNNGHITEVVFSKRK